MKKLLLKAVATVLCFVLFTTNVVLAHAAETNFWAQRRIAAAPASELFPLGRLNEQTSRISDGISSAAISSRIKAMLAKSSEASLLPLIRALSEDVGSVRKIISPSHSNGRIVIHIQDIHRNREAQTNIGKTVQELINQKTVDLVALEGAFGPMDFSWYRAYPHQDAVKAVADYLLQDNRISGPVHAALRLRSGQALPVFVGVDEKNHYDANVEAYRRAAPLVASLKKTTEQKFHELREMKAHTFNPALKDFDDHVRAYRNGSLRGERMCACSRGTRMIFHRKLKRSWPLSNWKKN